MVPYAPIILFTYNRVRELRQTITSLQQNTHAQYSELFIFSDGAKDTLDDAEAVAQVRQYLPAIDGFKNVQIHTHAHNIGLANNIITGIHKISNQYESFIVLEDDLLFSPYFLDFMNGGLKRYAQHHNVWCVNGFSINPKYLNFPKRYIHNTYFQYRTMSWGWASWSDRWRQCVWDVRTIMQDMKSAQQRMLLNKGGTDLTPMMMDLYLERINSWSVRFSYNVSTHNGVCISPKYSFTNIQASPTATHVASVQHHWKNNLKKAPRTISYPETENVHAVIAQSVAQKYGNIPLLLQGSIDTDMSSFVVSLLAFSLGTVRGTSLLNISRALIIQRVYNQVFGYIAHQSNSSLIPPYILPQSQADTIINTALHTIIATAQYHNNENPLYTLRPCNTTILDMIVTLSDIIHLGDIRGFLSIENLAYLSQHAIPIVWEVDDPALIRLLAPYSDIIRFNTIVLIVNNFTHKKELAKLAFIKNENIVHIPNTIDSDATASRYIQLYKKILASNPRSTHKNTRIPKTTRNHLQTVYLQLQHTILQHIVNNLYYPTKQYNAIIHSDAYQFIKGGLLQKIKLIAKKITKITGTYTILSNLYTKLKK